MRKYPKHPQARQILDIEIADPQTQIQDVTQTHDELGYLLYQTYRGTRNRNSAQIQSLQELKQEFEVIDMIHNKAHGKYVHKQQ